MAISYSTLVNIRGKAVDPVFSELLFLNKTVADNLVNLEDGVKCSTIVTENDNTTVQQAYVCGAPTASGTIGLTDLEVTPVKVMYYDEFCPDNLRCSRFGRSMKKGAWNIESSEFISLIMDNIAPNISSDLEFKFWNNALAATKTAVAALTPGAGQGSVGAAEQAVVAATTAGLYDGVVTKMIYNNGALGGRVKVAGTTITASNIAAEYAKLYTAIPAIVLQGRDNVMPYIYAPYSHMQLINIFNVTATYRDLFSVNGGKYYYNGIEIKFVPLPENVMIAARPDHILWLTDQTSDFNYLLIDKLQNNADTMFYKAVMTTYAHIVRQATNVLYVG